MKKVYFVQQLAKKEYKKIYIDYLIRYEWMNQRIQYLRNYTGILGKNYREIAREITSHQRRSKLHNKIGR